MSNTSLWIYIKSANLFCSKALVNNHYLYPEVLPLVSAAGKSAESNKSVVTSCDSPAHSYVESGSSLTFTARNTSPKLVHE